MMLISCFLWLLTTITLAQQFEEHEEEGIVIEMPSAYWTSEEMMAHENLDIPDNPEHQEHQEHQENAEEHFEIFHQFPARIIVQYDCKYHCNVKGDGVWPLYPCSPKFCACANGIAYTQSCPDILVFDLRYLVCNWQFNVPICN